jgi:hypothetical protein
VADTSAFFSTGAAVMVFLIGAVLTIPVSLLLVWRYSKAVLKAMRRHSAGVSVSLGTDTLVAALPGQDAAEPLGPPVTPLVIAVVDAGNGIAGNKSEESASRVARLALDGPWKTVIAYAIGGLGQAIVLAALWLLAAGIEIRPVRTLAVIWVQVWPIVFTVGLVTGGSRRILSAILYFGGLAGLFVLGGASLLEMGVLWLIMAGPPTVFLLVLLHRRWRAVGPLVFVFMLAGAAGAHFSSAVMATEAGMHAIVGLSVDSGANVLAVFAVLQLLAFGAAAFASWLVLLWLRGRYEAKAISDQSLLVDTIWLISCMYLALDLANVGIAWSAAAFGGFAVYKGLTALAFLAMHRLAGPKVNYRLLLLRVFGSRQRSEQLMTLVGSRWRYTGSIQLIGATDLAASTLEPHEFLDFVRGKLANRYINGPARLEQQLEEMDLMPDADGRFRINEFLCHDDTWRMTLSRLVASSDAVLMDLRGFSPTNQGCVFELRELVNVVPLTRVILIVDGTTDVDFLQEVLQHAWADMDAVSPNRHLQPARVTAYRLTRDDRRGAAALITGLARAAAPAPAGELAPGNRPVIALGASG